MFTQTHSMPQPAVANPDSSSVALQIDSLSKHFKPQGESPVTAIDNVSLKVNRGELLVLLGPSGCGKTTLLRAIAGLERPQRGKISIGGNSVFDADRRISSPPEKRAVSMVFQSYALWPHMKVSEIVAYPLKVRRVPRSEIRERVQRALDQVGMIHYANRYPSQLSGGQQQRVSLARALVAETELILFDEPLSNVDAKVRDQLKHELLEMQRELAFTAVYVTHDQAEAMHLAHRIAVLDSGKVAQLGHGTEIYDEPASEYVARFIGRSNDLEGRVVGALPRREIRALNDLIRIPWPRSGSNTMELTEQDIVSIMWRPESARVVPVDDLIPNSDDLTFESMVIARTYLGASIELMLQAQDQVFLVTVMPDSPVREGDRVRVIVPATKLHVFPKDRH